MLKQVLIGMSAAWVALAAVAQEGSNAFDPKLAASVGADDHGMRSYVLVILKTGPNKVPAGAERDEMFKGHFANMKRLAAEGKLAVAGPFDIPKHELQAMITRVMARDLPPAPGRVH